MQSLWKQLKVFFGCLEGIEKENDEASIRKHTEKDLGNW